MIQLAAKNINVILISRDAGLLMELARDISNEFHVRTVTIQADFSSDDQSLYDMLESRLQGFDIVYLINNVGTSHDTLDRFHVNTPDKLVARMINVNMMSMARMTRMLLPGMVVRRRGVIINVSSAFGRNPAPYLAMYGATKSFADYFSRALQKEFGKHHIAVQSLTPYIVSTNMTKNAPPTTLLPSAETFVRSALNTIGLESRTHGYLPHSILGTILDNAPSLVRFYYMKLFRYQANKLIEKQKLRQSGHK
ncbi:very-long-chain 3-oxoacyl-CoA reductase [Elysia marginata]|uniref:Very-long-chain 3-oxoacyl-CoA reductase n=1 Tax=Elysia marginata TaxID=1093978 RepID=A0AAV4H2Q6_9GAST|nr:very-long-chain 3-oxoacyl-CoA reductase [Elysia marginata]